jgi:hypothetical protein
MRPKKSIGGCNLFVAKRKIISYIRIDIVLNWMEWTPANKTKVSKAPPGSVRRPFIGYRPVVLLFGRT